MKKAIGAAIATALLAGCGGDSAESGLDENPSAAERGYSYPEAPPTQSGPLAPGVQGDLARLVGAAAAGQVDPEALEAIAASGDARLAWTISDLLRFTQAGASEDDLVAAFERLTEVEPSEDPAFGQSAWLSVTNHLIAWDLPAAPGYRKQKAKLFVALEPGWRPFFSDASSEIDWRLISWGGVLIDDRPPGDKRLCPEGCIPALDDPVLTPAEEGDWYPDDRTVFGLVVGGEAVAFPKNVMEVHELVNLSIGGRRIGIPYCTLCGSAQAYLLDSLPARFRPPVLRTSGLLSRSNKVMYDLLTESVFDTFTGQALSGPLHDAQVRLDQISVVASSWGEWKRAHPGTRIVARDGGIGQRYPADPLGGRDDSGPIFPIGDVDPRLAVQTDVVGVISPAGRALAFPAEAARTALGVGEEVTLAGVELFLDGGGLRARTDRGKELPAHQAFWFAWSQFHPGTALWAAPG